MYNKKYMNQVWSSKEEKAKIARAHTKEMAEKYGANIEMSIRNSKIYFEDFTKDYNQDTPPGSIPAIRLIKTDTIKCINIANKHAITKEIEGYNPPKICLLNFASFKNPGGRFIDGSMAQEEAICHATNLYNILSDKRITDKFYTPNLKSLNKALYKNRAIYTPNVVTFIPNNAGGKTMVTVDILTCAAPNYSAAHRYQKISREECNEVMDSRIKYILDIMDDNKVDVAILGAFGCGVFGNDPKFVAESFQKHIKSFDYHMKWCLFAIPGGPNFDAFKDVLTNGEMGVIYT